MSVVTQSASPAATSRLEEIHPKIAWHYEPIPILKAEANSYSPVFAFSAEILSKVFTSYAFKLARPSIQDGQERCLSVIATLDIFLQRSGVAPLTVMIRALDQDIPPSLLHHSERLCELVLAGDQEIVANFVNNIAM
ncbi:hypothetical protein DFH08DRAFT_1088551 [Mycena albidolilacea]|uniref:Uncharacterized protein n=1 Tax=Mycena albidolilacea TaxID=1033008 RepID=A0AAD6Z5M9_9AGAR|nr:hypothetical protein DFH08DRAFT_1088551 [Mycena albidolilacea]